MIDSEIRDNHRWIQLEGTHIGAVYGAGVLLRQDDVSAIRRRDVPEQA